MADDVRSRRAERVRQDRVKSFVPRYKWPIVGIVAIVLVVAVVAAFPGILPKGPLPKKFAHEHASFKVFINGEAVNFRDPAYDLSQTQESRSHIHVTENGGGSIIHLEASFPGGIPDVSLHQFFAVHGLTFDQGHFRLDSKGGHNGTEWRDNAAANQTWRVFVSKQGASGRGPYEELTGDYSQFMPRDLDKVLITYGNATAEELAAQEGQIPDPPGQPPATMPGAPSG